MSENLTADMKGNKKKKERKLTGQHAYVQGAGVYTPLVMSAVKKILQENYPGLLVPTPSPQELWARPRGKRIAASWWMPLIPTKRGSCATTMTVSGSRRLPHF